MRRLAWAKRRILFNPDTIDAGVAVVTVGKPLVSKLLRFLS